MPLFIALRLAGGWMVTTHQGEDSSSADGALDLVVPAVTDRVRELRRAARRYAERHGVMRPEDVEIAVGEAATNAVLHAYVGMAPGPVHLRGSLDDTSLVLVVHDEGTGLAPRHGSNGLG